MNLQEVLEKMRKADKVTVWEETVYRGEKQLFCGSVNQCISLKNLLSREVDSFYPELLGGLVVKLKGGK